jgi:lipoprotein-anchoring transpeptidase ErfK/SrfK
MPRFRASVAALAAIIVMLASMPAPVRGADGGLVIGSYARLTIHKLEMRIGPSVDRAVVRAIDKGEIVRVLSGPHSCAAGGGDCIGGWYEASYREWSGYLPQDGLAHTGLAGRSIARQLDRVVVVSLGRQQVEVYDHRRLLLITPTTTGKPQTPTVLGRFRVLAKKSPFVFRSPYPPGHPEWYADSPVEMAIKFHGDGGYALHDAPWRPPGGYGYKTNEWHVDPDGRPRQGSHGCVNLPLWSTRQMWDWIRIGDYVQVVEH